MALWLKCPECQAKNSPDQTACAACNAPLVNLPASKRVYILEPAGSAPPKAAAAAAAPAPSLALPTPPPVKVGPKKPRAAKKKA